MVSKAVLMRGRVQIRVFLMLLKLGVQQLKNNHIYVCVYIERERQRDCYTKNLMFFCIAKKKTAKKKPCNLKIYNIYTHTHKKESKYNAQNSHQITGEENKCSCLSFIP